MTCELCNGDMRYQIADHRAEVMLWVDCMDCMLEDNFKLHLKEGITRLLGNNASPQLMAQVIAELIVTGVSNNDSDNLDRIHDIVKAKESTELLIVGEAYAKWA